MFAATTLKEIEENPKPSNSGNNFCQWPSGCTNKWQKTGIIAGRPLNLCFKHYVKRDK